VLQFVLPQTLNGDLVALLPIDMNNLSELALIAGAPGGDYSNESDTGFTFTRDGITIVVSGSGFTYTGGVPDAGGLMTTIDVSRPSHEAYFFENLNADFGVFASGDAHAIASALLSGNVRIFGPQFGSTLVGFGANNLIEGGGPDNNIIYGGAGNDTLLAGGGNDHLYGGRGDDLLVAGSGNDYLDGGPGNNTAGFTQSFYSVTVTLNGNNPVIAYVGQYQHDTLVNIKNLLGGLAPDVFIGDSRNNLLVGGAGSDTINGGAGNDTIDGSYAGLNNHLGNVLTGGPGRDVFLFDTQYVHSVTERNFNTITDFQPGTDKVWLETHIFAGLTNSHGHLSAADFIAGPHVTEFSGNGSQVEYNTSTGDLYFNVDGEIAHFDGHPHLHASDFAVISETSNLGLGFIT
jgi:Ca2+-binding RTX toxin-like protein